METDGTRFPGPWLAKHREALRAVPPDFSLATFTDRRGRLRLPLARGCVSFIRRVTDTGQVEILGRLYFVGKRLTGTYAVATITTHRRALVIKQAHRIVKRYPFPIREPIVDPLVSPIRRGPESVPRLVEM